MSKRSGGLPERPRLKPHVAVVPFGDAQVILKGPGTFVRLAGEGVALLHALLPHLDGGHDLAGLVEASGLDETDVADVLEALALDGALEDAALDSELALDAAARERLAPQLNLWSHLLHNPAAAQERLGGATVLVLGLGRVGTAAADVLAGAGLGTLVLADARPIEASDRVLAPYAGADGPRAEALAAHLAARPTLGTADVAQLAETDLRRLERDDAAALLDGVDHAVVATDQPNATLFAAVNEAAIAARVAWTGVFADDLRAVVGPTVVPGATACWRCYQLRVLGAHPNMDRLMAYEQAREAGHAERATLGLPGASAAAGSLAAQAALLTTSGAVRPPLADRVVLVDHLTLEATPHRLLRMPRCPACSPMPVPDVDRLSLEPVTLS